MTAVFEPSPLALLRERLAGELRVSPGPQDTVAVLVRFLDDRADLMCRRNVTASAAEHLRVTADGMRLAATDVLDAAVAAFGPIPEHVPDQQVSSVSDADLLAHEESDAAREVSRRRLGQMVSAANERRQQRRNSR